MPRSLSGCTPRLTCSPSDSTASSATTSPPPTRATVRALLSNVDAGGTTQGGSTITQQLIKQSVLTSEQTFDRKTREVFLAVRLEEQMSKEEILERYLNTIYFGRDSYGIQTAAKAYFNVNAADLTLSQAAPRRNRQTGCGRAPLVRQMACS